MNPIIGGDFVSAESNNTQFFKADTEVLFGENLNNVLKNADFRIINLETPLTNALDPIKKFRSGLSAPVE